MYELYSTFIVPYFTFDKIKKNGCNIKFVKIYPDNNEVVLGSIYLDPNNHELDVYKDQHHDWGMEFKRKLRQSQIKLMRERMSLEDQKTFNCFELSYKGEVLYRWYFFNEVPIYGDKYYIHCKIFMSNDPEEDYFDLEEERNSTEYKIFY